MKLYCPHGGVCDKSHPHSGNHSNSYCEWTDAESLSREEADNVLRRNAAIVGLPFLGEMAIAMTAESAECPYCHSVFYAEKGRDPLHHHDEYCPEWPEEID